MTTFLALALTLAAATPETTAEREAASRAWSNCLFEDLASQRSAGHSVNVAVDISFLRCERQQRRHWRAVFNQYKNREGTAFATDAATSANQSLGKVLREILTHNLKASNDVKMRR